MFKKLLLITFFCSSVHGGRTFVDVSEEKLLEIQCKLYQICAQLGYSLKSKDDYEPLTLHERKKWVDQFYLIKTEFETAKSNYSQKNYDLVGQITWDFKKSKRKIKKAKSRVDKALTRLHEMQL